MLGTVVFLLFIASGECYYMHLKNGVTYWKVMYEDMKFELPCFKTTAEKSQFKQTWTESPTSYYQGSNNFTLHFRYVSFFESGEYVCKVLHKQQSNFVAYRHSVLVVSQPESGLVGSRRYFPRERCLPEVLAFLVQEGMQAICEPQVIVAGECLFKLDSVCRQVKREYKFEYKWEVFITWTLTIPKLAHYSQIAEECSMDLSCVAMARYDRYYDAMRDAKKRYMDKEQRSYEFNPTDLGDSMVRADRLLQFPVNVVTRCPAGTYLVHNVSCQPCPPGQYLPKQPESQSNHPESCMICTQAHPHFYGTYDCNSNPTGRPTVPTLPTVVHHGERMPSMLARNWVRIPGIVKAFLILTPLCMIASILIYCEWKRRRRTATADTLKVNLERGQSANQQAAAAAASAAAAAAYPQAGKREDPNWRGALSQGDASITLLHSPSKASKHSGMSNYSTMKRATHSSLELTSDTNK